MATLLVTGVTRFLGGTVLEEILHQETRLDLLLLVRADSPEAGLKRVKEDMRKFNVTGEKLVILHPQHILLGDLTPPEHFLNDPRLDQVTRVLSCTAAVSLGSNPLIWGVNVEGTLRLVQRMAQVESLQRFLRVGTAMSCSPEPDSLVVESAEFRECAEHLVEYTHLKSAIEQLIQQYCPTLPLVIARPSIVVDHTCHGCRPSSSIFWVFSMGLMLQKLLYSMENRIDVIPVDYCVDALLVLLDQPLAHGKVMHASAGEENSAEFAEIDQAMAQALEQTLMEDKYAQVNYDTLVKMRRELKGIFGPCSERLMLKTMRLYSMSVILSARSSNDKLLSMGISKPPCFTDYIGRCVETTRGLSIP